MSKFSNIHLILVIGSTIVVVLFLNITILSNANSQEYECNDL